MEFSLEPKNCLRSSLRQVLKNKIHTDVKIQVNGNKTYNLHKSLLSVRSEKFGYFFDYFENKNDSDTFFSEKLKPILKKTTSVFEDKKYFTDFSKENNESLFIPKKKPKSLKTIGWRLESNEKPASQVQAKSELAMELDSDEEDLNNLNFQLNESKDSDIKEDLSSEKKVIENKNGFLRFKFWKPNEKGRS